MSYFYIFTLVWISMVWSSDADEECTLTKYHSLPSVNLISVGVDYSQDNLIYLGTTSGAIVLNTTDFTYTDYLPDLTSVSDFIFDRSERQIVISPTKILDMTDIRSGEGYDLIGSYNLTRPVCGLLDTKGEALYIADQDVNTTTFKVYNISSDEITLRNTLNGTVRALCSNPKDNTTFYATLDNVVYRIGFKTDTAVPYFKFSLSSSQLNACTVVGSKLYVLDSLRSRIVKIESNTSSENYVGSSSDCVGSFLTNDTLMDWVIWRNKLLVVSLKGNLYLVDDEDQWKTPRVVYPVKPIPVPVPEPASVPVPIPVPVPETATVPAPVPAPVPTPLPVVQCVPTNNSGVVSYGINIVLCNNTGNDGVYDSVVNWDGIKYETKGNLAVYNLVINGSEVDIGGDVQIFGKLNLEDSQIKVNGNFTLTKKCKLVINSNSIITTNSCMNIDGDLILQKNNSKEITNGQVEVISSYSCHYGNFQNVFYESTSSSSCKTVTPDLVYSSKSLYVKYVVEDECNIIQEQTVDLEDYQLILVILFPSLILIAIVAGVAYHLHRNIEISNLMNNIRSQINSVELSEPIAGQ